MPATFTVNSAADAVDPNDGLLTLREAVAQANAAAGADRIVFDTTAMPDEPFSTQSFIRLTGGQLTLQGDLVIDGPGPEELLIRAEDLSRVFEVSAGVTVELAGLSIARGRVAAATGGGNGGGILNRGTLTVRNTVFAGNAAEDGGGAVANALGAALIVTDSTFDTNTAFDGGALVNFGTATISRSTFRTNFVNGLGGAIAGNGPLTITSSLLFDNRAAIGGAVYSVGDSDTTLINTTISGNQATGSEAPSFLGGGGIYSESRLTILHGTITDNHVATGLGGGIDGGRAGRAVLMHNTIVSGNSRGADADDDIAGPVLAESSHNLVGIAPGLILGGSGTQLGFTDPMLSLLADHGGPTLTHAPLPGSTALNAGDASLAPATDQRGLPRVFGPAVDIGAYEAQTLSLVVDVAADVRDNVFSVGDLSLREAVELSNRNPGRDAIAFAPALGGATIALTGIELALGDDVTITGPGAQQLAIFALFGAGLASRVFSVAAGVQAELSGLTITGGRNDDRGGGIINNGQLTLRDSVVIANTANVGGGIANELGATLTLDAVDIVGNTATLIGGGVDNLGTLIVNASVISSNAAIDGGGLYNHDVGTLTVTASTIADNLASSPDVFGGSGGGIRNDGDLTLTHSTLAGNFTTGAGGAIFSRGALNLNHVTLSGNRANADGGGIMNSGTLTMLHSTVTANRADADADGVGVGGGMRLFGGTAILHHSIAAGNFVAAGATINDGDGSLDPNSSFNLVGSGLSGVSDGVNGNHVGTLADPIDPRLGPLQDNGGPTLTHALFPDSPARDAGDPNLNPVPKNDQRGPGFPRVIAGRIDIGAVEAPLAYVVSLDAGVLSIVATTAPNTLTIRRSGPDLIFSDPATVFASNVGTLAPDWHSVAVPLASIAAGLTIDMREGNDTVAFDWLAGGVAVVPGGVSVNGGAGLDTLRCAANGNLTLANTWLAAAGGIVTFTDIERGVLRGGAGKNTLNAKAFHGSVILDGGAGHDRLIAARGRSILIGGRGKDMLIGGPGEDLLLGGATAHAATDAALISLLDEWTAAAPFNRRRANLRNGGGLNGTNVLAIATTPDDRAADQLRGGPARDWFWAFPPRDRLLDKAANERIR
ncbi:MAG: hypothetical protein L0Y71_02355 [Gemmataceae bacterium]|nr:hypothetical protein [Gemmataceae bacterium]